MRRKICGAIIYRCPQKRLKRTRLKEQRTSVFCYVPQNTDHCGESVVSNPRLFSISTKKKNKKRKECYWSLVKLPSYLIGLKSFFARATSGIVRIFDESEVRLKC